MTEPKHPNIPKSHHLVPRLHLQHFVGSDPKGHVWTYDKDHGNTRHAIPEETATFSHFYSRENDDGTYDVSAETQLADNEGLADPVYKELIRGNFPKNVEDRSIFSLFLAYVYFRTRAQRQDAANLMGLGIQSLMYAYAENDGAFNRLTRDLEAKRGEPMPPKIKDQIRGHMKDPSGFEIQIHKAQTFAAFGPSIKLAEIFLNMKWSLVAAKGSFLITSDNPLIKYVDPASVHHIYGDGGFMNKTINVSLALSPTVMLVLSHGDAVPQVATLDKLGVEEWNKHRAYYAEQFIYADAKRPELLELAKNFKGSRPRLTMQGYGPKKHAKIVVPRRWRDK